MKLTKSLLLITMLAGVALAQAPANKSTVPAKPATPPAASKSTPAMKPATPAPSKSTATVKPTVPVASKPTMPATKPEHSAAKPRVVAKHSPKVHHPAVKAAVAAKADVPAKPAEAGAAPEASDNVAPEIKRGRDPFVSVITERNGTVACTGTGKKCLIVDQVMLKGVVRSQNESIAVVSSTANKTYFLRENDPVYNGVVVKITPDSIIFRESVTDRLGKTVQREVVKKVNNTAA
jgi:hypothetical protein